MSFESIIASGEDKVMRPVSPAEREPNLLRLFRLLLSRWTPRVKWEGAREEMNVKKKQRELKKKKRNPGEKVKGAAAGRDGRENGKIR